MPKGKPWSNEEEKQLRTMLDERKPIDVIAQALKRSKESVKVKIKRIGIEVVVTPVSGLTTTSDLVLPAELPSVEETLKILCVAIDSLKAQGLDQAEVFRLRTLIQGCKIYKELLADYINYRGIEMKIAKMEEDYGRLLSEAKGLASKPAVSKVV